MIAPSIKELFHSLNDFEKEVLQKQREEFENEQSVRFTSLESYLCLLAEQVICRQKRGEFVPRSIEESRSDYYHQ